MRSLYANADAALQAIADGLERRAEKTLCKLAVRCRGNPVAFCSAMGIWTFYINGHLINTPKRLGDLFDRVLNEYGWSAIPAPVYIKISMDGEITRLTDW